MKRWQWAIRLLTRRMWFRAAMFSLFAVVLALAAPLIGSVIPYDIAAKIGARSVDNILNMLATSMLAVTTFSLTAMVSAYSGATSNITPRAVQLLIDDPTAQNALATFLGSFLFATVGIIALSTGMYGETGRVILYAGTVLVIIIIVVTLLRWIEHLTQFGRVSDTIRRVETAALRAARGMAQTPSFGPRRSLDVPTGVTRVFSERIGRVTYVDLTRLGELAADIGQGIHVTALAGALADPSRFLAWTEATVDDATRKKISAAFSIAQERMFDHDPRFGLVVLAEIASRALSPAVNDPGTAIAAVEAGTRVLAAMLDGREDEKFTGPEGVPLPAFAFPDLLEDLFRPVARDGAGIVEVGIRLQKALGALEAICPEAREDCRATATDALVRAFATLTHDADRAQLKDVHDRFWRPGCP